MKRYENKSTTSNRLQFKLASGTHGLRSELSRRDNESNICVCYELDKEENVEHFLLECHSFSNYGNGENSFDSFDTGYQNHTLCSQ
eukprot:Awhi_evm1s8161